MTLLLIIAISASCISTIEYDLLLSGHPEIMAINITLLALTILGWVGATFGDPGTVPANANF